MSYKANLIDGIIKLKSIFGETSVVKIDIVETGDDKGVAITGGQFGVGDRTNGHESVFGGGDSYEVEVAYHYSTANEVGTTITSATDITTAMQSDNASAASLFKTNTIGEVMLIGAAQPFFGVKMKYDSIGVLEPENITGEFLNNIDVWTSRNYMVTNANFPYEQVGWDFASFANEQVRFEQTIIDPLSTTWELRTLNINGVDVTKYWVRLRLTTLITTLPIVQQVKQHTSRTEINADGTIEFFGLARGIFTLQNGIENTVPNQASDPPNESVTYFTGGLNGATAKYQDNQFSDNGVNSIMVILPFVRGLDTSTSLVLSVSYYVRGVATGDVELIAEYQQVTDDFLYNTITTPDGVVSVIETIAVPSENVRRTVELEIPINEVGTISGGGVAIVLSRDARVANTNDTVSSAIVLTNTAVIGRRWTV